MSKVVSSLDELSAEQRSALSNFRQQHPRNWKSKLLDGWMRAAYPGPLQQIRNSLGPEWLSKVKESDFTHVIDAPSKVLGFVHVEPLEIDDDNEEHRSSCRP